MGFLRGNCSVGYFLRVILFLSKQTGLHLVVSKAVNSELIPVLYGIWTTWKMEYGSGGPHSIIESPTIEFEPVGSIFYGGSLFYLCHRIWTTHRK